MDYNVNILKFLHSRKVIDVSIDEPEIAVAPVFFNISLINV